MRKLSFLLLAFCIVFGIAMSLPAFGQVPLPPQPISHKIDNDFVHQQFGAEFTLVAEMAPAFGDLDGDGVEDVVIAARCKNPMLDQGDHNYDVIDPYYDYFGYGDPKLTTTFIEPDPARRGLVMLVIHGTGPDAWRAATPKAKFVIVNLPFRTVTVRKMKLRKKTIQAVFVEEARETNDSSALFFEGKKYRYVPMGGDME